MLTFFLKSLIFKECSKMFIRTQRVEKAHGGVAWRWWGAFPEPEVAFGHKFYFCQLLTKNTTNQRFKMCMKNI